MSNTVIKIENLSKSYRLGEIGTGTISHDLNRAWARIRGKEDPYAKVGVLNDRTKKAQKGEIVSALKDINLEVKQGEVLGIIGKNGAGKSTLLKILSRVTSPTSGSLKIKGRMASLLEVGTGFHPEMTGRENIYMNGTIMGMRKWEIDKKLDEIVDFAGVAKYLDTPTKRYSSGMTVRLGFAVAAFLEPEILVVDEVLAVGDAEFQKKAIGKMQDISAGEGRTVLFVSHNMSSIRSLCNKCVVIDKGEIPFIGEVDQGVNYYLRNFFKEKTFVQWNDLDAPGNESVKLIQASIHNAKGYDKSEIIQEGDGLELRFRIMNLLEGENQLDFTYHLFDEFNNLIFVGSTVYSGENLTFPNGISEIVSLIPQNILIKGKYRIGLFILLLNGRIPLFSSKDILAFEIVQKQEYFDPMGVKEGLIRPKLAWSKLEI